VEGEEEEEVAVVAAAAVAALESLVFPRPGIKTYIS
jgi:hypothetical protein